MPPRPGTKLALYQLSVKTHRTTITLSISSSSTISELKQHVFDAISQFQISDPQSLESEGGEIPKLDGPQSFELCKALRVGTGKRSKLSGEYNVLSEEDEIKSVLGNWEIVFIRFKDAESGELKPVKVQLPQLRDDSDDEGDLEPEVEKDLGVEQDEEMSDAPVAGPSRNLKRKSIPA